MAVTVTVLPVRGSEHTFRTSSVPARWHGLAVVVAGASTSGAGRLPVCTGPLRYYSMVSSLPHEVSSASSSSLSGDSSHTVVSRCTCSSNVLLLLQAEHRCRTTQRLASCDALQLQHVLYVLLRQDRVPTPGTKGRVWMVLSSMLCCWEMWVQNCFLSLVRKDHSLGGVASGTSSVPSLF